MSSNVLDIYELERQIFIQTLAQSPYTFENLIYTQRKQYNPQLFGPGSTFSTFSILNNIDLCDIVYEFITSKKLATDLESEISKYHLTTTLNSNGRLYDVKINYLNDPHRLNVQVKEGYIGSDEFTQSIILSCLIEFYLLSICPGLNTLSLILTGSICILPTDGVAGERIDRFGTILCEYSDLGTLDLCGKLEDYTQVVKITNIGDTSISYIRNLGYKNETSVSPSEISIKAMIPAFIISVTKQILVTLHILQENMLFNHGELIASSIGLQSTPCSTQYKCIVLDEPFTCKIQDYEHAAVTANMNSNIYRIYNRIWINDFLSDAMKESYVSMNKYVNLTSENSLISLLPKDLVDTKAYIIPETMSLTLYRQFMTSEMNIPQKQYPTFDTYTFMISFLLIPEVFYSVFTNTILTEIIWQPLFYDDDKPKIKKRLEDVISSSTPITFETVFTILLGVKLKFTVTSDVLTAITKYI